MSECRIAACAVRGAVPVLLSRVPNVVRMAWTSTVRPRSSRLGMALFGETGWWLDLAGEFGGGTWAYERPDGSANSVDLNDYRVILGSELRRADGWCLRAEAGYV